MSNVRKLVLIGETQLALYRRMALVRCFEELAADLVRRRLLSAACRPCYGLEAVGAGLCWHLRDDDLFFGPGYARGLALAKGVDPRDLLQPWLNNSQLPDDLFSQEGSAFRARFDASGFVGAGVLAKPSLRHAAGAGLGFRMRASDNVAAIVFPSHLLGSGAFHESVQLARAHSLPVVFVCDHRVAANAPPSQRLVMRIRAYGLPCVFIDGGDLAEVYAAANDAVVRARHEGPTFIECATACLQPQLYATPELEQEALAGWAECDPLSRMHDALVNQHNIRESLLNAALTDTHRELQSIIRKSPAAQRPPSSSSLLPLRTEPTHEQ